jgi:TetR/AcrR family transcriptional repressor of nem operon
MANPAIRQSLKKRQTHDRIIASAGRIARKNGLAAASVSRVMHGAGLTIGGFYAHFRSKRAMDAEVVQATLGGSSTPWSIDRYLTAAHRDDAAHGCAFPAMLSEVARAGEATRMALARAIDTRARELAKAVPGARGAAARQQALATLAICVGGLALARAMRGHPASDEVLSACRKWARQERRARRPYRRSSRTSSRT